MLLNTLGLVTWMTCRVWFLLQVEMKIVVCLAVTAMIRNRPWCLPNFLVSCQAGGGGGGWGKITQVIVHIYILSV